MFTVSIYIKENEITAALFDANYSEVARKSAACEISCMSAASLCKELLSDCKVNAEDVSCVSVATPNDCTPTALEEQLKIKCVRIEPTQARALGEAFLAGDKDFFIVLKIYDTVKSGVVIDKKIIDSELGQMVIDHGGYSHTDGRNGSFESYVCREGFARICAEAGVENAESVTPAALFSRNDDAANAAKERYIHHIAAALTNVINLFQPNGLIVDAFFTEAGDALTDGVMDIVLREQYSRTMKNKCTVEFTCGEKDTAVLLGAALRCR